MDEETPTYNQAVQMLRDFRQRILSDLVSARVNARLDASHDTMQKYLRLLDRISIVPYIFGRIREHALALRINGVDIGSGEMRKITAKYTGGLANYPLKPPLNVPSRNLPQVDVFRFTPPTLSLISEKTSEELWGNYFILQCNRGSHKETPDVQNVFFDYYKLRPVGRAYFELSLSNQTAGYEDYSSVKGEATVIARSVTPQTDSIIHDYVFYVFLDADFFGSSGKIETVPVVFVITNESAGNPQLTVMAGGKRLFTNVVGVYAGWLENGQFIGWTKVAGGYAEVVKHVTWASESELTIEVNDESYGTTNPPPNVYKHKALDEVTVTAIPNSGYSVENWILDGVMYAGTDSFTVRMYNDHVLKCIFGESTIVYLRPSSTHESVNVASYPADKELYECVNEEYSDGDASYIYDSRPIWCDYCNVYFDFPDGLIPEDATPNYVELYAIARNLNPMATVTVRLTVRINGNDYYGEYSLTAGDYKLLTHRFNYNPATGLPWTCSDIDDLVAGVHCYGMWSGLAYLSDQVRLTQFYVKVPYSTS